MLRRAFPADQGRKERLEKEHYLSSGMEAESVEVGGGVRAREGAGTEATRGLRQGCARRSWEVGGLEEAVSGTSRPNYEPQVCKDGGAGLPSVCPRAERRPVFPSAL